MLCTCHPPGNTSLCLRQLPAQALELLLAGSQGVLQLNLGACSAVQLHAQLLRLSLQRCEALQRLQPLLLRLLLAVCQLSDLGSQLLLQLATLRLDGVQSGL
jgi:hypothetical protein